MSLDRLYIEATKLLEKARRLGGLEREVLKYFISNISVGDIRAIEELKRAGIESPEEVINRLVELGLLERHPEVINLSKPLRLYVARKRVDVERLLS